jgi:hypothetical protein
MIVKLNCPPKPEESQKSSNFNGKAIPYPGFERFHSIYETENFRSTRDANVGVFLSDLLEESLN